MTAVITVRHPDGTTSRIRVPTKSLNREADEQAPAPN